MGGKEDRQLAKKKVASCNAIIQLIVYCTLRVVATKSLGQQFGPPLAHRLHFTR